MISVKKINELHDYVESRLHETTQEGYEELYPIRNMLDEILTEHYLNLHKKSKK